MNKDFRITIEPITEKAKQHMGNNPVAFNCDFIVCVAGHAEQDAAGHNILAMNTATIGNKRHVSNVLLNFLTDANDELLDGLKQAMGERLRGAIREKIAEYDAMQAN